MEMKRKFQGIWIPARLWLTKELTMQEKLFLVEIQSLDNEEGCFASNGYFADFFGISKTRVSLVVKSLIEKGYIDSTITYKPNSKQIDKRILRISNRGYLTFVKEGMQQNLNTPIQQKLKGNNTVSNNTINKDIVDYWNSLNISKHTYENKAVCKAISKLSKKEIESLKFAAKRYSIAYHDKDFYYSYKWTLDKFIKQSNGYKDWLDEGQRWVEYGKDETPTKPIQPITGICVGTLDDMEV